MSHHGQGHGRLATVVVQKAGHVRSSNHGWIIKTQSISAQPNYVPILSKINSRAMRREKSCTFDVERKWRGCEQDQQRLAAKDEEE